MMWYTYVYYLLINLNISQPQDRFLYSTQYFLHFLAFCEFIHQFVEISHLSGKWIIDLFYSVPTDHPCDEMSMGIQGSLIEQYFKSRLVINQLLDFLVIKTSQPCDDLMELFFRPSFFLDLGDIMRVDRSKSHGCYLCVVFRGDVHGIVGDLDDVIGVSRFF